MGSNYSVTDGSLKRLIERPQEALLCAKAKRQQQIFFCAKAKRQQQQSAQSEYVRV
ncbi:hypothetical protein LAV73_10120 [Lysinibacillus xylanilyticus]|uniref:hypothetical protein n=1 Tax=Lysinibacillus xylanilyticus TaxID=582475 RepID=UPI002B2490FB|nr:hypothetical protein [Lysinibacillus xylanilyticus]MEB2280352.1 hypothetical protein [Lysinibacillus xylanilyticus]